MAEDTDNQTPACPTCGAAAMVRIFYGLPSHEAFERAHRGELVLGGCMVSPDSPLWACTACHAHFGDHHNVFERLFPNASARQQAEEHQP